ncbi:PREDICTED: uncharacterized protein LOC104813209 isoform X2 [Tarenaya hassleriana]|uniref:uncharacterized protein LOC104813209 isoform X2 n=1 Tax=Tarenaya hassleriana TaxID=28532 RepID=UPI00053C2432|nr:PREDICTED: uncharacterized protein LOC104813209 isoform X2 [Tarenaya hassleriana]
MDIPTEHTKIPQGLDMQKNGYNGGSGSLGGVESPNRSIGRGQSSESIDLWKALENSGKATRIDSSRIMHRVGQRSKRCGTAKRRMPISTIHVHEEISEGVQELNQIMKERSCGLGFGNGGEGLMQGAIELERSLTDYMTRSRRKNRIKLLDDDMQLEIPSRSYRNIEDIARADIKMRLSALAYPRDDATNRRKQLKECSDSRSVTCDEADLSALTVENNNQSRSSKPGTGRIPNVIAKLMGLGEFQEHEDAASRKRKDSTFKIEIETDVSIESVKVGPRRKDADLPTKNSRCKVEKTQRDSTSMDTGSDLVMHETICRERDRTESRKHIREKERGKDSENKQRVRKPLLRSQKGTKRTLHNSETREERGYNEKEKFQRRRQNSDKAKAHRKSFSEADVALLDRETELSIRSNNPSGKEKKPVLTGKIFPKNIDQEVATQNETPENQNSDSEQGTWRELLGCYKDTDQIRRNQTEAAEAMTIIKSSDRNDKRKFEDDSLLLMLTTGEDGSHILKEAPADNFQETMLMGRSDIEVPTSISDGNANTLPKTMTPKGTKGEMETLSESDIQLKKIILRSRKFLNTAEALFKLDIPLRTLQTSGNDSDGGDENNLILDCGYELLKWKGRLHELSINPFLKGPISFSQVKSLDDLVKQLNKELEKLGSYGNQHFTGEILEDNLPEILERDVLCKESEVNSMWDMGWMLGFIERDDVISEIEQFVFNGLVEEVTRDLICT